MTQRLQLSNREALLVAQIADCFSAVAFLSVPLTVNALSCSRGRCPNHSRMERVPTSEPEFDGKSVKGNHCRGWKACTFLATGVALILVGGVWARNHHGDHHKVDELLELFGRKRIRQAALGGGARGWSASGDADSDSAKKAEKSWDLLGGKGPKFKNKPRVRREWRTLSDEMREKVANAFWTLKTLTTEAGQAKYGPDFHNHDDMLFLHSCATTDPKCDQGHFGPQFMTFHRALLLKYERAMLSVDPSIEAGRSEAKLM